MQRFLTVVLTTLFALVGVGQLSADPAYAGKTCEKRDRGGECEVWKEDNRDNEEGGDRSNDQDTSEPAEGATRTETRWLAECISGPRGETTDCRNYDPCEEGADYSHRQVELRDLVYRDGDWRPTTGWYFAHPLVQCVKVESELTEEQVRRAVVEFGMKVGGVQSAPPGGETLLDLDTIFWTEQGPYEFELDVLGTPIDLRATPVAYHWDFGDGNTATFETPGVSYADDRPMSDYHTHAYADTGNYDVTLTIEYQVDWNAGNGWQPISGTISSEPASYTLDVEEKRNRLRDGE